MTLSHCAPAVGADRRRRPPLSLRIELAGWMLTLLIGGAITAAPAGAQSRDSGARESQGPSGTLPAPTLTVEDIGRLVQAGISEDLIIAKLRKNGKAFDLSTDELLRLKKAGVSDRILNVMMDPGQPAPAQAEVSSVAVPAAGTPAPGIPDEVGVYWTEHNGELHRVEGIAVSNKRTGSTFASKMTLGIKRMRVNAQLNGPHAQLRIKERQPQFYFYLPGFTGVAVFTLALCLGANLTIFAAVDSILLRSLPFPHADRLVTVFHSYPKSGSPHSAASLPNYYDYREKIKSFASTAIITRDSEHAIIGAPGSPYRVERDRVSPEFFSTLG